jgi:hypothetical protein
MLMNIPFAYIADYSGLGFIVINHSVESNSQKDRKETTQNMPNGDDESKDENENFALKIFASPSKTLIIYDQRAATFLMYNARHSIQFHPEFSTPPPKQFFA